jgi:nitrogen fixation/metabolism regulation signal transduction histidine kinase
MLSVAMLSKIVRRFSLYHLPFLWGGLIAFLLGQTAFWIHQNQKLVNSDTKYRSVVQNKILQEIKTLAAESHEVTLLFQESHVISLIELKKKHKYPCLIFKNENLIFWSDYHFIPDYNLIAGNYQVKFFDLKNGMFLAYREFFKTGEGNNIEIYTFLPLYNRYNIENTYLQSSYNADIFSHKVSISNEPTLYTIFSDNGEVLFSLKYSSEQETPNLFWFIVALTGFVIAFVYLFVFIWRWQHFFFKKKIYDLFCILIALYFVFLRWLMLKNQIPFAFLEWDLFNPQLYASSFWSPSLGDLALNLMITLWILFHLQKNFPRTYLFQQLLRLSPTSQYLAALLIIVASYAVFYQIFFIFSTIFTDSQLVLDISKNINFSTPHLTAFLIFILLSAIYFFSLHLLGRLLIRLLEQKYTIFIVIFALATLLHTSWVYGNAQLHFLLSFINGVYILLLFYFHFPKYLYRFKYFSTLYLFIASLFCAVAGVYAFVYFGGKTQDVQMRKYAENLLEERDFSAEYSLDNLSEDIRLDAGIKEFFSSPFIDKRIIKQKIKKVHLKNEFPDYQVSVHTFDAMGYPIHTSSRSYQEWVLLYQKPEFRTDRTERFFINETQAIEQKIDVNLLRMYVDFIEIKRDTNTLGYIIIELKKKKNEPFRVYPELLRSERFKEPREFRDFSYAIFKNENLIYAYGNFNYAKKFKKSLLRISKLYEEGYLYQDFRHWAVKGEKGRAVVVSVPRYEFKNIFANFSLLFLLLILVTTQVLLFYGLNSYLKKTQLTFTTRIQLFLNAAFFLPLMIVSISTLSIISSSFDQDLNNSFIEKAQNAARSLVNSVQQYRNELIEKDELHKDLSAVAGYTQSDINLFDVSGKLLVASQTAIYDNQLLSRYINSEVLWKIVEQKEQSVMFSEAVGKLGYKSVYWAIRSYENNQLLAILSIPFFDAEDERQKKLIDVITTIINIFTIVFIIFVAISYFASHILTEPLSLITQKIRKTTLYAYNEPIQWDSDDEIGLMVNEYNKMLVKLEESKQALAQTEKESAWREMAKQVAHEIKNPLTPMKLTLQHLQMRIRTENPELEKLTARPFETLLTQIDLLSDIATSFSAFARMTTPKNELFDLSEVLKQTLQLYESNQEIHLIRMIEKGKFQVRGDKQLMSQIFTNIILNAIQAVPSDRKPEICVSLYCQNNMAHIEIRDNGSGIPEEIRHKVFLPNFSTKFTGSGIGLALAKRGIEHAGGKIWFETQTNIGTCFFIELPLFL